MKTTNHLTPTVFYHDFLDWLVRLEPFHSDDLEPPMTADRFYWLARIQFSTATRVSETLNFTPSDFDFDHRIVTIRNPKTGHNKSKMRSDGTFIEKIIPQKTTFFPFDAKPFEKLCSKFNQDERLFTVTRATAWKYYKNATILGGLRICGIKNVKIIQDGWTHLLRSSCAVMFEELGAKESLRNAKMRHSPRSMGQLYTKKDIHAVLDFEDEHLAVCPAKPVIDRSYGPYCEVVA